MNAELLHTFCRWLNESSFPIEDWTNEATLQNQLGLFLNQWLPRESRVALEVNVPKLLGIKEKLTKKEADLVITGDDVHSAVEVKFWKDAGTYNIGMFRCYEDIAFLEDLVRLGFADSSLLFFTTIKQHRERAVKDPSPKNIENYPLYKSFRFDQVLERKVRIKTGQLDQEVEIGGKYPIEWTHLRGDVWYAVIAVSSQGLPV
jgi:hypothetical protein